MLLKRKKQFNSTKEVFDNINNPYNLGGIFSDFDSCINFIFNNLITYHIEMTIKENKNWEEDLYNQYFFLKPDNA